LQRPGFEIAAEVINVQGAFLKMWVLGLLLFGSFHADAQEAEVIYFGGYGASQAQMGCWEEGARNNPTYRSAYSFRGVPYPVGASAGSASAVQVGSATIKKIVDEINRNPNKRYVIVGHSSGAALSNQVAQLVRNPSQIELVNLDGFAPSAALQKRVKSTCWYAQNKRAGLLSNNASSMKSNCQNSRSYEAPHCQTKWCLHFSLVNKRTPAGLGTDFKANGYNTCSTNLDYLANATSGAVRSESSSSPRTPTQR
jgi:hypothetical protein